MDDSSFSVGILSERDWWPVVCARIICLGELPST